MPEFAKFAITTNPAGILDHIKKLLNNGNVRQMDAKE